jgi:hypothetical protein
MVFREVIQNQIVNYITEVTNRPVPHWQFEKGQ